MFRKLNKKLREAICFRDHKALVQLISDSSDIDATIDGSDTILHCAARSGFREIVMEIISHSPDVNLVNKQGKTPLHCAMTQRPRQVGDCRVIEYDGHYVEYDGDFNRDIVELLIANGADINALDKEGNSPLHYAMQNAVSKAALLLFSAGSDLYAKNNKNKTPYDVAVECLGSDKAEYCVSHKDFRLHLAAMSGSDGHVIQKLIDNGHDINKQVASGHSPLHYALGWNCHLFAAKQLLEAGSSVSIQDADGDTPLHIAAENGYSSIVKLLLNNDADPTIKNKANIMPIDKAKKKLSGLNKDDHMFDGYEETINML